MIVASLIGMLLAGVILLFVSGPTMFWIFGLFLCLFVGPAQSSSRTFLARLAPIGKEGQLFGLYATTGRAVSFLAPTLFGIFIVLFGTDRAGMVGILLVLGRRVAVPAAGQAATAGSSAGNRGPGLRLSHGPQVSTPTHHPQEPGSPLNGPTTSEVIQPP